MQQSPAILQSSLTDDVISAWLQEIVDPAPAHWPPSPPLSPNPTPPKRKAASQPRSNNHPRRKAVCTAANMEDRVRATPRTSSRRRGGGGNTGAVAHSTEGASDSSIDEEQEYTDSLTPRRPTRPIPDNIPVTSQGHATVGAETAVDDLFRSVPPSLTGYATAIERRSIASESNRPSSAASSQAGKYTKSPVKGIASLQFVEKPVLLRPLETLDQIPTNVKELFDKLRSISGGRHVIPEAISQEVKRKLPVLDIGLNDTNIDTAPSTRSLRGLQHELDTLCYVVQDTRQARYENHSETYWNGRVHLPILTAAIERDRDPNGGVRVLDATSAMIAPSCRPRRTPHVNLEAKMVDFCICISDLDTRDAASRAVNSQADLFPIHRTPSSSSASSSAMSMSSNGNQRKRKHQDSVPESINHTESAPFTTSPITVSIETKKPGGNEDSARAQLSVWTSAQFMRLHQLLGPDPVDITLPVLCVSGSLWEVLFVVEKQDCIEMIPLYRFDNDTLLGCYIVMAMLRALRGWSETVFRRWFLDAFDNQ